MKRFLAILLSCVLAATCSCAVRTVYVTQNETEKEAVEDTQGATSFVEDTEKEDVADTNQMTDCATDAPTEDISIPAGTLNGQTYVNGDLGIGCTLGEGWRFLTSEELAKKNSASNVPSVETDASSASGDIASDSTAVDTAGATDTTGGSDDISSPVYVMGAVYEDGFSSITISLEFIGEEILSLIDMEQFLQASAVAMQPSFEALGYTDFQYDTDNVNIDGKIFHCLDISSKNGVFKLVQRMFCFKSGNWLASVCISDYDGALAENIEECFFLTEE